MPFTVKTEMPDQRVIDVISTFVDSCLREEHWRQFKWAPGESDKAWLSFGLTKDPKAPRPTPVPYVFPDEGAPVFTITAEDPNKSGGTITKVVTKADIQKALEIPSQSAITRRVIREMAEECAHDSDTAELLMQLIVYGEIVYG